MEVPAPEYNPTNNNTNNTICLQLAWRIAYANKRQLYTTYNEKLKWTV